MPQTFKMEITGDKAFIKAANAYAKKQGIDLEKILSDGAISLENESKASILSHKSKGNIYLRGSTQHQASTAGNPPNSDTGTLVKNITIEKIKGGFDIGSRKGAPWGAWLEFGTNKISPRPWLQPAYDKVTKELMQYFKERLGRP